MQTLRLKVNNDILKNLLWFLSRFDENEIQIISENDQFVAVQEYLRKELSEMENGNRDFLSLEELDDKLETTIQKHEN